MEIKYRVGTHEDSKTIAKLVDIASGGIIKYLFHDLVPGKTHLEVVNYSLEQNHYPFTYENAILATDEKDIVGITLSFPGSYHKITNEMREFFSQEKLTHLLPFYSVEIENTWFLQSLSVIESHRKHGIGDKLITLTKERAIQNGFNTLSLIVFADNTLAIPLYKRNNFKIIKQIPLEENEFIQHKSGCFLMEAKL